MILRVAALITFIIGAVLAFVDDSPDIVELTGIGFVGLALWVAATITGDRL